MHEQNNVWLLYLAEQFYNINELLFTISNTGNLLQI